MSLSSTAWAITGSIHLAAGAGNFDIRLAGPTGLTLAIDTGTQRQETISYTPSSTGVLRIFVESVSGSGTYHLDVSTPAVTVELMTDE